MRQILSDLQDTSQRLLNIEATLGTARQLRHLRAQEIEFSAEEYAVRVTRTRPDNVTAFNATEDTKLEPGDVVEIKRIQNEPESSTEAALSQQNLRQEFVPVEQQPTLASYCSETAGESTDSPVSAESSPILSPEILETTSRFLPRAIILRQLRGHKRRQSPIRLQPSV